MNEIMKNREFLKDTLRTTIDFRRSDQHRGVSPPPLQEAVDNDLPRISLPYNNSFKKEVQETDLVQAITNRKSRRAFSNVNLKIEELAFLLWATQGQRNKNGPPHFRTVPSAGARHSFETHLFINRVKKVPQGLYRYLPLSHEIVLIRPFDMSIKSELSNAVLGQKFVAESAVVFVWTTIPYRMEWRYLESAHRVILLDAGHVCQNLYLACEAIGAGTCGIAAYNQKEMDSLLNVDGEHQFTIYLAPVGKIPS